MQRLVLERAENAAHGELAGALSSVRAALTLVRLVSRGVRSVL